MPSQITSSLPLNEALIHLLVERKSTAHKENSQVVEYSLREVSLFSTTTEVLGWRCQGARLRLASRQAHVIENADMCRQKD
jgi:hypothetical protein